jgi:hypothetical protein
MEWAPAALYIVLLYSQGLTWYFLKQEAGEMLNTAVLLVGVLALLHRGRVTGTSYGWLAAAFLCLVLISGVDSHAEAAALSLGLYRAVSVCLAFVLFSATARKTSGLRAICTTLALCAALNASVALWGTITHHSLFGVTAADVGVGAFGYDASSGRSGGVMGENYSGIYNSPGVVAAVALLYRRGRRLAGFCLLLIGITGTVVSFSRGSVLAITTAVCLFLFLKAKTLNPGHLLRASILVLTTGAVGVMTYSFALQQLPTVLQADMFARFSEKGVTNDSRGQILLTYLEEVRDKPLTGAGPGHLNAAAAHGSAVPHNSFMDVAVELGLPALALFAAAFLRPLRAVKAARQDARVGYLYACYAGTLVSLMTLSSPYLRIAWVLAGAIVGGAASQTHTSGASGHERLPGRRSQQLPSTSARFDVGRPGNP